MGIILESIDSNLVRSSEDSLERNKEQENYMKYIEEHRNFVKLSYEKFFVPLLNLSNISEKFSDEEFKKAIIICGNERIPNHDDSKYDEEEFEYYRLKYNPTTYEKEMGNDFKNWVEDKFNEAWKHHYTVNPHHPRYWFDEKLSVAKDMDLVSIIEMICDWEAMSMKFNDDTVRWYKNDADKEKSVMSSKTKELLEEILLNITH